MRSLLAQKAVQIEGHAEIIFGDCTCVCWAQCLRGLGFGVCGMFFWASCLGSGVAASLRSKEKSDAQGSDKVVLQPHTILFNESLTFTRVWNDLMVDGYISGLSISYLH